MNKRLLSALKKTKCLASHGTFRSAMDLKLIICLPWIMEQLWLYLKDLKEYILGHFHARSQQEDIHYLGNPYELYWHDVEET